MVRRTNPNLRIKRKYLTWMSEARGVSEATVDRAAASIDTYLAWLKGKDLRQFHSEKALAFKRHLESDRTGRNRPRSASTINGILRDLRSFMTWLADQPGYRSRIRHADAAYFSPDRKSEQARRGELFKPAPSPEQVAHAILSMPSETLLERRDRALMAFLFLTGAREKAAMTVRMGHVDLTNACVQFDGRLVETKFGKRFTVAFLPVGDTFVAILRDWITELRTDLMWGQTDPVFPKTAVGIGVTGGFESRGLERAPWKSPARVVKIFRGAFEAAGLPPYSPHSIRRTLVQLSNDHCRTPEEFKAWSQNLGHEDVLTTFMNYGSIAPGRQVELIARMREGPEDASVIDDA
ncbi:site-specific integrase [Tropicimonas sp. IMCC6043]|uniref:tyrosine-type recombinase/integrase n=1 Tax=Tropicimonas sp. IMCC6043 TaxID=2510645 RepID=UPI00101C339B|nr:site-specific integrase [Tropicimonas sp. IMCC6043]RYH08455.1 integrase [Tropicimonas sp. IMCC6043]